MRRMKRALTGTGRLVALALAALLALVLVPALPAQAAYYPPAFVRSMAGEGRAGVYAWGAQYNPATDEIVVGDYLNYRVRRYDTSGNEVGSFYRGNPNGQPYSIAVDPRNGDIYVPEIADGSDFGVFAKYDKFGSFKFAFSTSSDYNAWATVDANGYLYVADSHYWNTSGDPPRVRVYSVNDGSQSASEVGNWSIVRNDLQMPRAYGIDVYNGTVYLSDTINRIVMKWSTSGVWQGSFGSGYFGGDVRGVTVDESHGWLYVVDASNDQVDKFDLSGNHLGVIGGDGNGDGQFAGPRQPTVDAAGNLWVTDYGNFRIQQFDAGGAFVRDAPDPKRTPGDAMLAESRDVALNPVTGEVWAADSWNQRVQKFAGDGTFLGKWGQRGNGLYGFNYPRGIGVDPLTGRIFVANERGHYVQVFEPDMYSGPFTLGTGGVDSSGTNFLRWPNDIEFYNGVAIVADRASGYVKGFSTTTGLELGKISQTNHGIAVDPATGNIFVLNANNDRVYKYSAYNGSQITYWGSSGTGNGQFRNPKDAVVCGGLLFVTDDQLSRIQAFSLTGTYLGKWGGLGTGPHQMRNPSGIACGPDGNLYVSDAGNDRILVYNPNAAKPTYESTKPTVSVTAPTNGQQLHSAVTFVGNASDNAGVANVEVSVKDTATGQWWDPSNSTWSSTQKWALAALQGSPTTNMMYKWTFLGASYGHSYEASVRARDISSNASNTTTLAFSVATPPPPDTTAPSGVVTQPVAGQKFPAGTVNISGQAHDDRGVAAAKVGVRNSATSQWWNGGAWQASFTWLDATVAGPGATSTTWSYVWAPPAAGNYAVTVRIDDTSGNTTGTLPQVNFSTLATADTIAADGTVSAPTQNQAIPLAAIPFSGSAVDDVAVGSVKVAIRNTATLQWWNGSGWSASFTWLDASLTSPYMVSTAWSYTWEPPATGSYALQVRAEDTSGNVDPTKPWITFTVTDPLPPDTTAPEGAVAVPFAGQAFPLGMITLSGTATDDRGVAEAAVSIQDSVSGLWWDGSQWQASVAWLPTALSGASATAKTWTYQWAPPSGGEYSLGLRVEDTSGNQSAQLPGVGFSVSSTTDTTPPDGALSTPAEGQQIPFGSDVTFAGSATDDIGVAAVKISIRDNATMQWWNGSGWGAQTWLAATLASPGAGSSTWSSTWEDPPPGNYGLQVRTDDTSGNTDPTKPWVNFTVVPDTTDPAGSLDTPLAGQRFPLGTVALSGAASDNVGVAGVEVALQDTGTGQWWDGTAWQAGQAWLPAQVAASGAASTSWTFSWAAPSGGTYGATFRVADTSSNISTPPALTTFDVTSGPDATAPDGTVTVPAKNSTHPLSPIAMSGSASDDVGVGAVKIAIRDNATMLWWTGTAWGAYTTLNAALSTPGMPTSAWTYTWAPPAPGSYGMSLRTDDTSGNIDPTKPWVNFTVTP